MFNKKFIFVFSFLSFLFSFLSAHAESPFGDYKNRFVIGARANFVASSTEYKKDDYSTISNNLSLASDGTGYSLKVGYRFYFSKSEPSSGFLELEAFKDFGTVESSEVKYSNNINKFDFEPTVGGRLNLGIEMMRKHAFFAYFGLQGIDYKYYFNNKEKPAKEDSTIAYLLGVGYEYNITQYIGINFAIDYFVFQFDSPAYLELTTGERIVNMESTSIGLRAGINLKF